MHGGRCRSGLNSITLQRPSVLPSKAINCSSKRHGGQRPVTPLVFNALTVLPNQTVLLVSRMGRHSENLPSRWLYDLHAQHADLTMLGARLNSVLSDCERTTPRLIPGAGTTAEKQSYTYKDTTAKANVAYYYRLEEVSLSGERSAVATVRLRGHVSAANKRLWKWADVKAGN